ncbi:GNAT family N-acetyltransferase [Microbacterium sp. P02]|uniref:GNAT family N-acetyltransferase n=1 Tax=unclassified Microbacterium TaxID=2609290 RepID=UPI00366D4B92
MSTIAIRPWSDEDLPLLLVGNAPAMTEHLGGPESDSDVENRHLRYLDHWATGTARMFAVTDGDFAVGAIGWWSTTWRGDDVYETGWFVVPEAQGRGVAQQTLELVVRDAVENGHRGLLTAFPSVDNGPSNALCRKVGFALDGTADFPFRGTTLTVNVWAIDLAELRRERRNP